MNTGAGFGNILLAFLPPPKAQLAPQTSRDKEAAGAVLYISNNSIYDTHTHRHMHTYVDTYTDMHTQPYNVV